MPQGAVTGRKRMGVSLDKSAQARKDRPALDIAPVPTAGSKPMNMKFDIQSAANRTSDEERAARLVDPGFGRIFSAAGFGMRIVSRA